MGEKEEKKTRQKKKEKGGEKGTQWATVHVITV